MRRSLTCTAVATLAIAALGVLRSPAVAEPTPGTPAVYDTIDAVEVWGNRIVVTGIIAGDTTVSERLYTIQDNSISTGQGEAAARCDRLALLAMSKPGKFQFATLRPQDASRFSCKLIVRTP